MAREPLHPEAQPYNWLVHRIFRAALKRRIDSHARGLLVDVGCGVKPYADLTSGRVSRHLGIDHPESEHDRRRVDVHGTAGDTGLKDSCADTVLSTFVLEHLERPAEALREAARILRPGGALIIAAPMFWHLHEEPRDFFRYTRHGLTFLMKEAGLDVIECAPLAGFVTTVAIQASYYLEGRGGALLKPTIRMAQWLIQMAAWGIHRIGRDGRHDFTWAIIAVGRKPAS